MKELVIKSLVSETGLKKQEIENLVEIPPNPELGDYAFPCFTLSKKFKSSPDKIASSIAFKIKSKNFESVVSKGPYVNFFLNKKELASSVISEILKKKDKYGSNNFAKSKKIMIEFSQANTHKAFHIGHVRGTSLGESIARIIEFSGNRPLRVNYQGDTGMHVAKWLWCYEKYHSREALKKDESWIASIYVDAVKRIHKNESLQEEVDEINRKLESRKDKSLNSLWKKTKSLSLDSLENIYKELNTYFDRYFFESEFEKSGREISESLVKNNIAEVSEGATIIRLDKSNLGVWVLLRKDGTVLYSAKDLALAKKKFNEFKINESIYVVGAEQKHHIMQLFETLKLMNFKQAKDCRYIPVTEVRLPHGKMSSRTGDNVLYSDFKNELVNHAATEIKKRGPISKKEVEERALLISLAALKYSMLKQDTNKNIIFEKKEALSFEGNTGPYLLYTYARAKSILRKAKYKKSIKSNSVKTISDTEKALILELSQFPSIVKEAYEKFAPNLIANYSYSLAQKFNEFYHQEKVIGSDEEQFKLQLIDAFAQTLKNSLSLLGISVLEQM